MKALKAKGYVTPKDYTRYMRFHVLKGKYYRIKTRLILLGIIAVCATLVAFGFTTGNNGLFIGAGAIALALFMFIYTINVNVKRVCNSNAKTVRGQQELIFGKNGFLFNLLLKNEEDNEYNEIFYEELEQVYLAQHAIYIYIEQRSVIIIPVRNLQVTPVEAKQFLVKYLPEGKLITCI